MKYQNVKQSHIPIEGFNNSSGQWQQLTQIPSGQDGTSKTWQEFDTILQVPINISMIRFVLNAGWVLDNSTGNAITWFDDFRIYPVKKGVFDKIWIYSSDTKINISELFSNDDDSFVNNFEKISQTEYQVDINSKKPFLLSFSEAYDSRWVAEIENDQEIIQFNSIPLYNSINGFWIDETGEFQITIRYAPQELFDLGLLISFLFIFSCIILVLYTIKKQYRFCEIRKCLKEKLQRK